MSDTTVTNNAEQSRFEATKDGELAGFIQYVARDGGVLDLTHTEVDDAFEGQGVGSALVRGTLDQIRADGNKVVATCPFVKGYIGKHDEYADLLAA